MLSHDNITWTVGNFRDNYMDLGHDDRVCSYLPLSHIAAQLIDLHMPMATGATTYFCQSDALKGSLTVTLKGAGVSLLSHHICTLLGLLMNKYPRILIYPPPSPPPTFPHKNSSDMAMVYCLCLCLCRRATHRILWCSPGLGKNARKNGAGGAWREHRKEGDCIVGHGHWGRALSTRPVWTRRWRAVGICLCQPHGLFTGEKSLGIGSM